MNAVQPVLLRLPGEEVERELRFTLGARKRIEDKFGKGLLQALKEQGYGALPDILYALMHDRKGKPPDFDVEELRENLPADGGVEILAAVMSAATQGQTPKNEIEALLKLEQEKEARKMLEELIGSGSGVSADSASGSPTDSSGGDISNPKSSPDTSDSKSENGTLITVPV